MKLDGRGGGGKIYPTSWIKPIFRRGGENSRLSVLLQISPFDKINVLRDMQKEQGKIP